MIGTVGEPINEEAWNWYNEVVGNSKCPIVDTWWQTETGGILISPIPNSFSGKPAYATLPFIGIQPALMDSNGKEINKLKAEGRLAIKFPWPSIVRTIWGNHKKDIKRHIFQHLMVFIFLVMVRNVKKWSL